MNRPHLPLVAVLMWSAVWLAACNKPTDPAQTQTPAEQAAAADAAAASGTPPATAVPDPEPTPAKPKPRPKPTPKPSQPRPLPEPQAQLCADCGTVSAITPVSQKGEAGAMGTLGGAVVGGIIGHQFGGGRGKDLATVAGAAGGAMAGREIEKRARGTTVYDIGVRMEDGSHRTVTVADPAGLSVGSRVRVDGNNLVPR